MAIPTVYNYFPTLTDLFGACITDTTSRAPAVGPKTLAGTSDRERRLAALVPALFARYRFLSRWLRWSQHEAHLVPELGAFHARFREQHLQLIRDAIAPRGGGRAPAAAVGLAEVLTRYSSWETLTQVHGLSDDQAATAVLGALRSIISARRKKRCLRYRLHRTRDSRERRALVWQSRVPTKQPHAGERCLPPVYGIGVILRYLERPEAQMQVRQDIQFHGGDHGTAVIVIP